MNILAAIPWILYLYYYDQSAGHSLDFIPLLLWPLWRPFPGYYTSIIMTILAAIPWILYHFYYDHSGGHSLDIIPLLLRPFWRPFPGYYTSFIMTILANIPWILYLFYYDHYGDHSLVFIVKLPFLFYKLQKVQNKVVILTHGLPFHALVHTEKNILSLLSYSRKLMCDGKAYCIYW